MYVRLFDSRTSFLKWTYASKLKQLWTRSKLKEVGDDEALTASATSNLHKHGRVVTRSAFVRFMRDSFNIQQPGLLRTVDRLFEVLDVGHTGSLPWSELFVALARIAGGTTAQRAVGGVGIHGRYHKCSNRAWWRILCARLSIFRCATWMDVGRLMHTRFAISCSEVLQWLRQRENKQEMF